MALPYEYGWVYKYTVSELTCGVQPNRSPTSSRTPLTSALATITWARLIMLL